MLTKDIINEYRPTPNTKVLFVTGRLASAGLARVLDSLTTVDFDFEIRVLDVEIAAWLDISTIAKQIGDLTDVATVIIPGKTTGDDEELAEILGVEVVRGPSCYSELPVFLEEIQLDDDATLDAPSPRIVVLPGVESGPYLAKIYEIPFIDLNVLVREEIASNSLAGKKLKASLNDKSGLPHNILIELVRTAMIGKKGWVLSGYPNNMRAIEWLDETNILLDCVLISTNDQSKVAQYYSDRPQKILINTSNNTTEIEKESLVKVETLMQSCVVPDYGMAS
jgi:adenylate kinase family enzyme